MADIDIPRLRALCDAATPGPWTALHNGSYAYDDRPKGGDDEAEEWHVKGPFVLDCGDYTGLDKPNAGFIAEARSALPALLDEVEALRAVRDAARALREDRDWSVADAKAAKLALDAALAKAGGA